MSTVADAEDFMCPRADPRVDVRREQRMPRKSVLLDSMRGLRRRRRCIARILQSLLEVEHNVVGPIMQLGVVHDSDLLDIASRQNNLEKEVS